MAFSYFQDETILKILGYLDLTTLRRCSQLNRHFHSLCNDSFLYTRLSLRPYWSKLHDEALLGLSERCQHLQQLDLSWCGSYNTISSTNIKRYPVLQFANNFLCLNGVDIFYTNNFRFITSCCRGLTHVRLNCCKFVTNAVVKTLSDTCRNLKEIGLRNCVAVNEAGFLHLTSLSHLENLDLYRTTINTDSLIAILKANRNLRHLNIGDYPFLT